jgi:hypothetical protein
MNVLAGADFFTVEVLPWRGLVTYYVLFFMDIWIDAVMFCTIATGSSADRFGRC